MTKTVNKAALEVRNILNYNEYSFRYDQIEKTNMRMTMKNDHPGMQERKYEAGKMDNGVKKKIVTAWDY